MYYGFKIRIITISNAVYFRNINIEIILFCLVQSWYIYFKSISLISCQRNVLNLLRYHRLITNPIIYLIFINHRCSQILHNPGNYKIFVDLSINIIDRYNSHGTCRHVLTIYHNLQTQCIPAVNSCIIAPATIRILQKQTIFHMIIRQGNLIGS